MKKCKGCGEIKKHDDFYKQSNSPDGLKYKCKSCEFFLKKKYYNSDLGKTTVAIYENSYLGKVRDLKRKHKKRISGKQLAHDTLRSAVRNGSIKRYPCMKCGSLRVHAHHDDYSKPLNVLWLCPKHHMERHVELRSMSRD